MKISLKRTTGSSMPEDDLAILCRGGGIPMFGHSDLGIFNNFGASFIFYLGKNR